MQKKVEVDGCIVVAGVVEERKREGDEEDSDYEDGKGLGVRFLQAERRKSKERREKNERFMSHIGARGGENGLSYLGIIFPFFSFWVIKENGLMIFGSGLSPSDPMFRFRLFLSFFRILSELFNTYKTKSNQIKT